MKVFLHDPLVDLDIAVPPLLLETCPFFSGPFTVPCFPLLGLFSFTDFLLFVPGMPHRHYIHTLLQPPSPRHCILMQRTSSHWGSEGHALHSCSRTPHQHFCLLLEVSTWIFSPIILSTFELQIIQFLPLKCSSSFLNLLSQPLTKHCQFVLLRISFADVLFHSIVAP